MFLLVYYFKFTENGKTAELKIPNMFIKSPKSKKKDESGLSPEERASIVADTLNNKLWDECLQICETQGKKVFNNVDQIIYFLFVTSRFIP